MTTFSRIIEERQLMLLVRMKTKSKELMLIDLEKP